MSVLPKMPVKLTFDPRLSGNADIRELWAMQAGRVLTLLWVPTHLISSCWWATAIRIAARIEMRRPVTVDALFECFSPEVVGGMDFTSTDSRVFCQESLPYFTGKRSVEYMGLVSGWAQFSVSDPEQTALGRELVARGWAVYELGDVCGEECHHFKLTGAGRAAFCAEKRRRIDGGQS